MLVSVVGIAVAWPISRESAIGLATTANRYDLVSDEQMEWLRELRANRKVLEDGLGELTQPFAGVTRSAMNARDVVVRRK